MRAWCVGQLHPILVILIGYKSLSLGRPPSICLDHVDCKRPSYIVLGVRSSDGRGSCT